MVCDANNEVDQPNIVETRSRSRVVNNHIRSPNPQSTDSRRQQRHENASSSSRHGLNNGALFGSSASSSLIRKDKDNKARQNLITKQSDRHSGSSEGKHSFFIGFKTFQLSNLNAILEGRVYKLLVQRGCFYTLV